jgi:hypothetical protein
VGDTEQASTRHSEQFPSSTTTNTNTTNLSSLSIAASEIFDLQSILRQVGRLEQLSIRDTSSLRHPRCNVLDKLWKGWSHLSSEATPQLAVRQLRLHTFELDEVSAKSMNAAIKLRDLESLVLHRCYNTESFLATLQGMIPNLTSFTDDGAFWEWAGLTNGSSPLSTFVRTLPKLRHFKAAVDWTDEVDPSLLAAISQLHDLRTLHLEVASNLDAGRLHKLCESCPCLEQLVLSLPHALETFAVDSNPIFANFICHLEDLHDLVCLRLIFRCGQALWPRYNTEIELDESMVQSFAGHVFTLLHRTSHKLQALVIEPRRTTSYDYSDRFVAKQYGYLCGMQSASSGEHEVAVKPIEVCMIKHQVPESDLLYDTIRDFC